MNDYMKGCIDTCYVVSGNKTSFIKNIKIATGLLNKGVSANQYIQELLEKLP